MLIHKDKHNNVFVPFGSYHIENNVTKALINLLSRSDKVTVQQYLSRYIDLPEDILETCTFSYFLQSAPDSKLKEDIHNLTIENKRLVGLNPSGKTWNNDLLISEYTENIKKTSQEIKSQFETSDEKSNLSTKNKKQIIKEEINEVTAITKGRGSIPDAWILVYNSGKLKACVIIETKLYDLNPLQLRNHAEKSLKVNLSKQRECLYYEKFDDLYKFFNERFGTLTSSEKRLTGDFLEYLTLLGVADVSMISESEIRFYEELKTSRPENKDFYTRILTNKIEEHIKNLLIKHGYKYSIKDQRIYFNDINEINSVLEIELDNELLKFSTEIGVKSRYTSEKILSKLQQQDAAVQDIKRLYADDATYQRFIRISNNLNHHYLFISESDDIEKYLNIIEQNTIFKYYTKKEIKELIIEKNINLKSDYNQTVINNLKNGKTKKWHVLEYLRIIQPLSLKTNGQFDYIQLDKSVLETVERVHKAAKHIEDMQ